MDCSEDLRGMFDEDDSISSSSKKAQESKDGWVQTNLQNNLQK